MPTKYTHFKNKKKILSGANEIRTHSSEDSEELEIRHLATTYSFNLI